MTGATLATAFECLGCGELIRFVFTQDFEAGKPYEMSAACIYCNHAYSVSTKVIVDLPRLK